MKKLFFILAVCLLMFSATLAQTKYELPENSLVIETQPVTPHRTLILWMQNPEKHAREEAAFYACPDETRGSFYEGKTSVSLIDSGTQKIIGSIEVDNGNLVKMSLDQTWNIKTAIGLVAVINLD